MATQTNLVASFENGAVQAFVDMNDQNGNITKGRVVNNGDQPAYMYAVLDVPINGVSTYGVRANAGQTVSVNFPANTLRYTWVVEDGVGSWQLQGVSIFCQYPAA